MTKLMKRRVGRPVAIAAVLSAATLMLQAEPEQSVGTWGSIGAVADARAGAAAVPLSDGRTLIAGGAAGDGVPTDSVVVYDPLANSLAAVGHLRAARTGHTATILEDGRVVIAGGMTDGRISSEIELFDPASGTSSVVALMAQPRTRHAAARLGDDTVLIVGGVTVGDVVLQSAELFAPAAASVTPVPSDLRQPRSGASATTLIDGRVLIAGGHDGDVDLATAEIFDPASQVFTLVDTHLSEPRSGHTAVLLPHNNGVLIAGGIAAGSPVALADLFLPAELPDPFSYGVGTFVATGPMTVARAAAVGGPAGHAGYAFVSGGGSADAEAYRYATIRTGKDDYAPGEQAIITGSGWQPGEDVALRFQEDPAVHPDSVLTVTADSAGNISWDQWAPEEHDLGVRFYLLAAGVRSARRAQTTFTDSISVSITSAAFAWHRTGEQPGGFAVSVSGTYTCNTAGSANNRCTVVNNLTITVAGVAGSKVVTGLANAATGAAWGPVTLEFRTVPAAGQFAIPAPDGKFDVRATLNTNAPNSPSVDTENNYFGTDNTAPQTDIQCNGAACSNPYDATVQVKLFAHDGDSATSSGVDTTLYCVDTANSCTPATTYPGGSGFDVLYDAGATRYVRYASTDEVGNIENTSSQIIVFAAVNTAPGVAFTTAPTTANENDTRTYDFSITDPDAGQTFTFVGGFPDCGSGGTLVSSAIDSVAKTGTFDCSFADGPANSTVRVQVQDSFSPPAQSDIAQAAVVVSNVAPTATFSNGGPVSEGSAVAISFSSPFDPSSADVAAGFRYSYDCANNASALATTFAAAGTSATSSCTYGDEGDGAYTIVARIFDKDSGYSQYTTSVQVSNAAPVKTGDTFSFNPYTGTASATISVSDAGWLDRVTSSFNWAGAVTAGTPGSYGPAAAAPLVGTFASSHTFAPGCIAPPISVRVSDNDGGAVDHVFAAADTLGVHTVGFLAPLKDGVRNVVKHGNVIPVKLSIRDCEGTPITSRTLTIRLVNGIVAAEDVGAGTEEIAPTSVSAADTTGFLRVVDSHYLYNTATKGLTVGLPYTIIIRDGTFVVATAVVEAKK